MHTFYPTDTFHSVPVLYTVKVKGHEDSTGGVPGLGTGWEIILVTVVEGKPFVPIWSLYRAVYLETQIKEQH